MLNLNGIKKLRVEIVHYFFLLFFKGKWIKKTVTNVSLKIKKKGKIFIFNDFFMKNGLSPFVGWKLIFCCDFWGIINLQQKKLLRNNHKYFYYKKISHKINWLLIFIILLKILCLCFTTYFFLYFCGFIFLHWLYVFMHCIFFLHWK